MSFVTSCPKRIEKVNLEYKILYMKKNKLSWLNQWDILNNKISKKLANNLCNNERSANIVAYGINVLINDIEKGIILVTTFTTMGLISMFAKSFIIIAMLRMWMGGSHRKTMLTCILQSYAEFMSVYLISRIIDYTIQMQIFVTLIICLIDLLYCPIILSKRGKYKKRKLYLFKCIALINILILSTICFYVGNNLKILILSCEIIQIMDVILAKITKLKGERL